MNKLEPSQWIKDPYLKHDKDLELIELVNTETTESLTVAKQDADRVLKLIQQRFTCIVNSGKVYIIDNDDKLVGLPTNLKFDDLTVEDIEHIRDWLNYLNRG